MHILGMPCWSKTEWRTNARRQRRRWVSGASALDASYVCWYGHSRQLLRPLWRRLAGAGRDTPRRERDAPSNSWPPWTNPPCTQLCSGSGVTISPYPPHRAPRERKREREGERGGGRERAPARARETCIRNGITCNPPPHLAAQNHNIPPAASTMRRTISSVKSRHELPLPSRWRMRER